MKGIGVVVVAATATLVTSATVHTQRATNKSDMTGAWKFVIQNQDSIPIGTTVAVISKEGNDFMVVDPATGTKSKAKQTNDGWELMMPAELQPARKTRLMTTFPFGQPAEWMQPARQVVDTVDAWTPSRADLVWTGVGNADNVNYKVKAFKLQSLWACSHKDPTHTATSADEMRECTQKYQCTGWHQINGQ